MQFVAGGSLQERIDQEAPLELKEVLRIAMQTAAGLAAAHAQGVVHRDVKPANILLENGVQRVKLTDFGLARVMDDASLTLSGVIAGTPQYMAPEQAWGRDVDARADLFSLGAVMYAMCSGHSPFRARTTMAVLKRVCEDPPRPLRAINPDVPSWLVAIIEKLLAKNPDERFQRATEVSELLGRWLSHVQQPTVVAVPVGQAFQPDPNVSKNVISPSAASPEIRAVRASGQPGKADLREAARGPSAVTLTRAWIPLLVMCGVMALVVIEQLHLAAGIRNPARLETRDVIEPFGIAVAHILAAALSYGVFFVGWNTLGGRQRLAMCIILGILTWSYIGAVENLRTEYAVPFWPQLILNGIYLLAIAARHVSQHGEEMLNLPGDGKGGSPPNPVGTADPTAQRAEVFRPLGWKQAFWPVIVIGVLMAIGTTLIDGRGTNNMMSFLGFAVSNLAVAFGIGSTFRAAWNTTSWLVWFGAVLLLMTLGQGFVYGASYQQAPELAKLTFGLQGVMSLAALFGLFFVRPLIARSSGRWMTERLTGWQRLTAVVCFTIFGVPLSFIAVWSLSRNPSGPMTEAGPKKIHMIRLRDPSSGTAKRRLPELDERGFPTPTLLSQGEPDISNDFVPTRETSGLTPTARQAAALKPLQGRWVVLTLQGDEPLLVAPAAGGMAGGAGGFGRAMAAPPAQAVTPTNVDQLRFLEFRGVDLILNDSEQNRLSAEVHKDRELLLLMNDGSAVRHGVFTIADDRLVICWTSRNQPIPRGFQPKPHEQLVVCRREWSRSSRADGKANVAVEKFDENSKLQKAEMPFSPREAAALQAAWAEKSKSPVEVTNSIGLKLRVIPTGSFGDAHGVATLAQSVGGAGAGSFGGMMGGGGAGAGFGSMAAGPRSGERGHEAMSGPILVGTHEVTVAQFRQFVEDSKYVTEAERSENGQPAEPHSWRKPEIEQDSDQHPVVQVSFEDALAFCHWLSVKEKKPYRLLTRREWEFCARAGSWLPATLGPGKLPYRSQFFTTTAPVGSYSANPFGLHDFIGNVAEWAWHNDILSENDPRRSAPNTGIWTGDPTVFCGGDFRQHINRSQPNEWLHPAATTTPPVIGFRVACDLTAASVVSLPKHWPTNQLFLWQELVRIRTLADSAAKSNDGKTDGEKPGEPTTQPAGKLIDAVWLEMLVRAEQMPYAVEWLDFEIERRATPNGESANDFVHGRIEDAGAEAGWKLLDLTPSLRLLEQTEFAPDPIATPFLNPALTMPIPKAVSGRWASPDVRRVLSSSFVRLEPAIQKPQLFRFIDFDTPHGSHYYRVRLKYRVPGLTPETVQTTSWFLSMAEADINFDSLDQRKLPENIPVIELKSQPPVQDTVPPNSGKGNFRKRRQ